MMGECCCSGPRVDLGYSEDPYWNGCRVRGCNRGSVNFVK